MVKKLTYLFLALLLPGIIFLFLRFFGQNRFDIPVYFQNGVTDSIRCKIKTHGQYCIADSVMEKWSRKGTAILIVYSKEKEPGWMQKMTDANKLKFIALDTKNDSEKFLKDCVFFLKNPWSAVLIDDQNRIRGYYKMGDREEMDRLEVEVKILLKNY
ncbi:MAG: hypothetical protein JST48_13650 [Bacteroidetes bacterium]|nr:hypothetical protein [Bacteroidota bacterium]